jgi:uncharacterized membrane protein YczE
VAAAPGGPLTAGAERAASSGGPTRSGLRHRLPRLVLGLTLCGLGIAVMVAAELGLGPWDVLHQGISNLTGVPIGTVTIAVGAGVLLMWIPLHERPGLGTLLNVVIIGVVIDLALLVLVTPSSFGARVAMMVSGPVLFAVGSGFYLGVDLGSGPRDGVMTGLARRGWPVGIARATIEFTALGLGWALGGTVGAGTVVFAVSIGPLVHLCLPWLALREPAHGEAPRSGDPGLRSAR